MRRICKEYKTRNNIKLDPDEDKGKRKNATESQMLKNKYKLAK